MALIPCPDCGTQVSDAAATCPKCSRPIAAPAPVIVRAAKSPGVAAVLSFFFSGLGQIYNGRIGKGLGFMVLQFVNAGLMFVIIGFVTFPLTWIWGMVDAYQDAEAINRGDAAPGGSPAAVLVAAVGLLGGIVLVGVLAAVAIPQYAAYKRQAQDAKAKSALHNAATAMEAIYGSNGSTYEGATTARLLEYGYAPSDDVSLDVVDADKKRFYLRAIPSGGSTFAWEFDSDTGKITGATETHVKATDEGFELLREERRIANARSEREERAAGERRAKAWIGQEKQRALGSPPPTSPPPPRDPEEMARLQREADARREAERQRFAEATARREREAEEQRLRLAAIDREKAQAAESARVSAEMDRVREQIERAASPWSKLAKGMKPGDVETLLGKPKKVEGGAHMEFWMYIDTNIVGRGVVSFAEGRVVSWRDPWS